ncbi:class I SAM-dependent methyltransferase [Candidatus Saccharibacteria bacterium]|nr:class I SAM-dependent methyltransferase [Candidatus Saccharibacteria bacterium]
MKEQRKSQRRNVPRASSATGFARRQAGGTKAVRKADQYDDPKYNYQDYWAGREYEHAAETMALKRLLKGQHFEQAVDVGGGYGRLSKFLTTFADKVTLAEPSQQQLDIAKIYLKDTPQVEQKLLQAAGLKMKDDSVDLVLVVRVLHHLPDPSPEFTEIARILKPGGTFILEFANDAHFLNRVRYGIKGKKVPKKPVDISTNKGSKIPFVNHHPKTIIEMLGKAGFEVETALSGSNLRSPALKKILGKNIRVGLEKVLQPMLAPLYFGPSVWLRLKKR